MLARLIKRVKQELRTQNVLLPFADASRAGRPRPPLSTSLGGSIRRYGGGLAIR